MKNLSKRNKILLSVVGVVVVVAIAGVVFPQVGGAELFGATTFVTPSSATVYVSKTQTFSVPGYAAACSWNAGPTTIASIEGPTSGPSLTLKGRAAGTMSVFVRCAWNMGGQARLDVVPLPVPVISYIPDTGRRPPLLKPGEQLTLCTGDSAVQWAIVQQAYDLIKIANISLSGSSSAPGCATVTGLAVGWGDVRATNTLGGWSIARVEVCAPGVYGC